MTPDGETLGILGDSLRRWWRRNWLALPLCFVLTYFGYHAIHGNHGLLAWVDVSHDISQLEMQLAARRAERDRLEILIKGLGPDELDEDLLEEQLRGLGYVKRRELIVLKPGSAE